jgi:hypothetical protein
MTVFTATVIQDKKPEAKEPEADTPASRQTADLAF